MTATLLLLRRKLLVCAFCYLWASVVLADNVAPLQPFGTLPEIIFTHYGDVRQHHALCVLQARRSNPSANITVITHKDSDLKAWKDIATDTGVKIYTPADWELLRKFEEVYKHASINGYQKEMYCIYRHLMLYQYMVEQQIPSFIYLDLDIAVFDDLSKAIPPNSTISNLGTFAIHWTQHSLAAFARYIWHFYKREPLAIAQNIAAIGLFREKYHQELSKDPLVSWWPSDMKRYHVSDMWLFLNFIKTTHELKILCGPIMTLVPNPDCPPALQLMRNIKHHPNLRGFSGAYTPERMQQLFKWSLHPQYGFSRPFMTSETSKGVITSVVPGMHFQGPTKNLLGPLLCKDLLSHFGNNPGVLTACQDAQV